MKLMNVRPIISIPIFVTCICAGFWFYTQWDLKRFKRSLPKGPAVESASVMSSAKSAPPLQVESVPPPQDVPDSLPYTSVDPESEQVDSQSSEIAESIVGGTQHAGDAFFDWFSGEDYEETEAGSLTSGDVSDVSDVSTDTPYDRGFVRAGFDDYNAYLQSDPEYAYQRLDDALREQYGDDSDVDILVQHTRQLNDGTATIDSILENLEAQIRLMVKNNHPPEAFEEVRSAQKFLRETKQLKEDGAKINLELGVRIE